MVVEVPFEEQPDFVQLMFSVPYNLNLYGAYFAVGVSELYLNDTDIYDEMYYGEGPFKREPAGRMIQFSSERGETLRGRKYPRDVTALPCSEASGDDDAGHVQAHDERGHAAIGRGKPLQAWRGVLLAQS